MNHVPATSADLIIAMPVFEDWAAVLKLLEQFAEIRGRLPEKLHFILVDDGSVSGPPPELSAAICGGATTLEVLPLARNLGHQRAIAIALCYVYDTHQAEGIVVMDADGEDPPSAIPALLKQSYGRENDRVVFANRKRRSEGPLFAFFYHLYRFIHWCLTGVRVRVGNFSYLPQRFLHRLAVSSELWNHYAAAVFASKIPYVTVPVARARRLEGRSQMNFTGFVSHGLSAISVFSAVMGARVLLALAALSFLAVVLLVVVVAVRIFTTHAIAGWATYSAGLLLVLIVQFLTMSAAFAFVVLGRRSDAKIIPIRDYRHFLATPLPTEHG